jgi:hypothetical protein
VVFARLMLVGLSYYFANTLAQTALIGEPMVRAYFEAKEMRSLMKTFYSSWHLHC